MRRNENEQVRHLENDLPTIVDKSPSNGFLTKVDLTGAIFYTIRAVLPWPGIKVQIDAHQEASLPGKDLLTFFAGLKIALFHNGSSCYSFYMKLLKLPTPWLRGR